MSFTKHQTIEIMYVVSWKCEISIMDNLTKSIVKTYVLNKNNFIFIYSNTIHKLIIKEKYKIYHI